MNSARSLSFAIPGAIIVFAIVGNAVASLLQRNLFSNAVRIIVMIQ